MSYVLIPIVFACGLITGCATSPSPQAQASAARRVQYYPGRDENEASYYWGRATYLTINRPEAGQSGFWCQIANDDSRARSARCLAAAMLFGAYVQPGFNTVKMRTAIPDPHWLRESTINQCEAVGGRWPYLIEGSHFTLLLFPDLKDWRIDFTLTASTKHPQLSAQDATSFLNGTLSDKSVRIEEFIMMYPLPGTKYGTVEEMHNARGVGIKVVPDGWFEF